MNAYLILNETSFVTTDAVTTEPISLWSSEARAKEELGKIAGAEGVSITEGADSFYAPVNPVTRIETDEYFIIEMEIDSRG